MNARIQPLADPKSQDESILQLLRGGQHDDAFQELARAYQVKLFHLCLLYFRDRAQAEDALQQSLLRIWRNLHIYDAQRAALYTWLYQITKNQCLTIVESRLRDRLIGAAEMQTVEDLTTPDTSEVCLHDALRKAVDQLPEDERRVILLFYYEDCSVKEVANMLGMPEGTVKTHLHRGREALRELISQPGLPARQPRTETKR